MILLRPISAPALKKGSTSYIKHPSHFEILKREKKEKSGCTNKTFPLHTPSKPFRRSVPLQPCFMPSFLSAVCLHTAASFYFFFPFTCPLTLLSGDSLKTACSTDCSDCGWCRLGGHRITDTRCINYPPPQKKSIPRATPGNPCDLQFREFAFRPCDRAQQLDHLPPKSAGWNMTGPIGVF